jgi:hypothetical protein
MTLDDVMDYAQDHIEADAWIADKKIPVITAVKGDISSQVQQKLGKLGICIVIEPGDCDIIHSAGVPHFKGELLAFFVFENVLLNRAKATHFHAVEVAAKLVHLFKPGVFTSAPLVINKFPLYRSSDKLLVYRGSTIGALSVTEPVLPEEPAP